MRRALFALGLLFLFGADALHPSTPPPPPPGKARIRRVVRELSASAPTPLPSTPISFLDAGVALADECTGAALGFSDGVALTVARTSTVTCTNSDAGLTTISANLPALQSQGLLEEGATTNYVLQSHNFGSATWLKTSGGGASAPTATSNTSDVLDPFGGNNASKVVLPSVTLANSFSIIRQSMSSGQAFPPGTSSACIYAKKASGTSTAYMSPVLFAGTVRCTATMAMTTVWQRFCCTVNLGSGGTGAWDFGVNLTDVNQSAQGAQTFYVYGAQGEVQPYPTSYIDTGATQVTRTATTLSRPRPSMTDNVGCMNATIFTNNVVSGQRWLSWASGGSAYLTSSTAAGFADTAGNATTATAGGSILGAATVESVAWRSSSSSTSITNAGVAGTGVYGGLWTGTTLYLGSTSGTSNHLNGFISKLWLRNSYTGCP